MKKAQIYPVNAGSAPAYVWKWRCISDKAESDTVFNFYYDCLENAQKAGYEVELTRAQGMTAPGGASSTLR